ncbi:hypothetical protein CSUI_008288 [Cystoisospora suis]|uniref:Uncharacterized protein n=1 Tax=Cystoisospora suis TaxID=483139 RepID=A0A2C6KK08_9APIC|nr:hypothetical protein CSUI_008288 [Cystoisospora suis]
MASFPAYDLGKATMKSSEISCHGPCGTGRGCSSPPDFWLELFPRLHA